MLTYSFENIDTESMYEHLYRCIKQDILQKKLRAGEKLPSKRTFAKNLGVSTITVESAYAQLVAEGFLYTLPKRGYYVCELELSLIHIFTRRKKPCQGLLSIDREEKGG